MINLVYLKKKKSFLTAVANFFFFTNTSIEMAMALKLWTVINTSAFFYQLPFIYNYHRMTITYYSLDAAEMISFISLDEGVNPCPAE